MENKCKKCYENDRTPDENDCKKCQEVSIDGVDVSKCRYAEKSIPIDCSIDNCFCYENNDCYYKQMKRLEQKLEKIKEIASKYSQHEGYLLDGLFTDLVDELSEVLKDE